MKARKGRVDNQLGIALYIQQSQWPVRRMKAINVEWMFGLGASRTVCQLGKVTVERIKKREPSNVLERVRRQDERERRERVTRGNRILSKRRQCNVRGHTLRVRIITLFLIIAYLYEVTKKSWSEAEEAASSSHFPLPEAVDMVLSKRCMVFVL